MRNIIKEMEKYPDRKWIEIEGEIIGWIDTPVPQHRVDADKVINDIKKHIGRDVD